MSREDIIEFESSETANHAAIEANVHQSAVSHILGLIYKILGVIPAPGPIISFIFMSFTFIIWHRFTNALEVNLCFL